MPYITGCDRNDYNEDLQHLISDIAEQGWKVGDVTYAVYCIVQHWFCDKPKFQTIAEIRGMLSSVRSEFDRRYAFAYEDKKIRENGDVLVTDIERHPTSKPGTITYHVCPCCSHEVQVKG
jgi:hypothetical protein